MPIVVPNNILIPEVGRILDSGRDVVLMAKGNSMLPFIVGERDSVRLRKCGAESLGIGDIVLAEAQDGVYVLHRIIKIDGEKFILHGDGNLKKYECCTGEKILGRVTGLIGPDGNERNPGKARLWLLLCPFAQHYLAVFYYRVIYRFIQGK